MCIFENHVQCVYTYYIILCTVYTNIYLYIHIHAHTHFGFTSFPHHQTPFMHTFRTHSHGALSPTSCATYLTTFHSWPLDQAPPAGPRSRFQRSALRCCKAHRAHSSSAAKVSLMGGCNSASVRSDTCAKPSRPPKPHKKHGLCKMTSLLKTAIVEFHVYAFSNKLVRLTIRWSVLISLKNHTKLPNKTSPTIKRHEP